MSKDYNQMTLLELLNRNDNKLLAGAEEYNIKNFEKIHGIKLPDEYSELLKYTNGAELLEGDITLYSLYDEKNHVKGSRQLGIANSPIMKKSIPEELLVIGIYNFGDPICLNLKTGSIVQWSHEDNEPFLEYSNIKEWMISSIEEMDLI